MATTADDALILGLIRAPRVECETRTNRSFIDQGWILTMDFLPVGGGWSLDTAIALPRPPLVSVDSVAFRDSSGVVNTLDPALFTCEPGTPGRLGPVFGTVFPIALPQVGGATIRCTCGHGPDAASVPDGIRTAILVLLSHYYYNRTADAEAPRAVDSLLGPYAWSSYG